MTCLFRPQSRSHHPSIGAALRGAWAPTLFIAAAGLCLGMPEARASDIKIKVISPGSGFDDSLPADDHIVAILSYEVDEKTSDCGASQGQTTSLRLLMRADGRYRGTEVRSRIVCGRGKGKANVAREAAQTRQDGRLTAERLSRFLDRVSELSGQPRELAAASEDTYRTTIQLSPDSRGVLSERELPSTVQTGAKATASAQFMQRFIKTGKID